MTEKIPTDEEILEGLYASYTVGEAGVYVTTGPNEEGIRKALAQARAAGRLEGAREQREADIARLEDLIRRAKINDWDFNGLFSEINWSRTLKAITPQEDKKL